MSCTELRTYIRLPPSVMNVTWREFWLVPQCAKSWGARSAEWSCDFSRGLSLADQRSLGGCCPIQISLFVYLHKLGCLLPVAGRRTARPPTNSVQCICTAYFWLGRVCL
ncbi:conserved hypothetical protein [Coccidioides posadasii str. Silveira]|uniref:Uncharacterized protein n=1 Tax=Coccidioides posadasii (strain RMSCC 757 / Silveira) TaxID=443226 RepID=E9DD28_COCPS|nr:conserved hypothetical protein [Coccidioides posadasii str. Silveira]